MGCCLPQVIRAAGAWRLDGAEAVRKLGSTQLEVLDLSRTATVVDDRLANALRELHVSRARWPLSCIPCSCMRS